MSAIGINDYNSTHQQPACTLNNAIKQNDATISFFFEALDYNVTGCKGISRLVWTFLSLLKFENQNRVKLHCNKKYLLLAPCEIPTYVATTRQYKLGSGLLQHSIPNLPPTKNSSKLKVITILYKEGMVLYSKHTKLVTLYSFISQIGGNLGLFLGFSCLSTILTLYSCLHRCNCNMQSHQILTVQK